MSLVDDLVFITPDHKASERFKDIIRYTYARYVDFEAYPVIPLEDTGPKCGGTHIYYLGMNYLNSEVVDALKAEPWPKGTVLYLYGEMYGERAAEEGWARWDIVGPEVTVF